MHAQERDYLQHLLLGALYTRSQILVFKGGTAIRLIYRGNRFSEDLDFNGTGGISDLRKLWADVIADLADYGIQAEARNDWESEVGYSFDVSYRGPLHDGRDRSKGKVRIDINRRPEAVATRRELVNSEYDDVRPFVVTILTPEHLLAEKVRALLVRGAPRDLYDIWLLLGLGIAPDRALIDAKLALYGLAFSAAALRAAAGSLQANWERDLQPLLPQPLAYEDVWPVVEAWSRRVAGDEQR
jgi:predicted nucleotidyltransferase component of viral defense system